MDLLLLTKVYPYGTEEAFIENEIPIMSRYYENIFIIACEVPKDEKTVRTVPNNVRILKITAEKSSRQKLKDVISSMSLRSNSDYTNEVKKDLKFKQFLFLRYFEAKSSRIYKKVIESGFLNELKARDYVLYSYWLFCTARVGTFIMNTIPAKYSFTRAHRYDLYENRNVLNYLPYREMFLERYDNIFPCSLDGENYLRGKYMDFSEKIKKSYLGTRDHGVSQCGRQSPFKIVSCSRVEPVKRVISLAKAISKMDDCDIQWVHIGSGTEFAELENYVKEHNLNCKCKLLGNMANSDIMKLYKCESFNLFVNVSESEGVPVAIMEAISFGIPVVATDVGGTSEVVKNGLNGTLISEHFTTEELVQSIRFYIDLDNNGYRAYRECAREIWANNFQAVENYRRLHERITNL